MPDNVKVCSVYMELAPHGSLLDMIAKAGGILPENVAGYCILQVLEGLRDLHRDGYVHCDLKPENVLIFPSYTHGELCELKLAGFSLAKEPNGPNPVECLFQGEPDYLAPEAVGPCGMISSAVDIFSLGVMVSEMLGAIVTEGGKMIYFTGGLSLLAKDFVRRRIVPNPVARATAEELMNHPFVRQSLGVLKFPVPSCLSNEVVQGRFF
ncbi:hypothetical protein AALP_AA5G207300 [Arabis alpina]|uniref:Protein kinase domain-containing protein n=1 Tax=Arabis alpina TaxID=50452 RepID=A0A087GYE2_ARAAL|nr:hypothetical protein AALP_AA5G207300 [Arabis alpina]